jgi:hypothetical protein
MNERAACINNEQYGEQKREKKRGWGEEEKITAET